MLAYRSFKMLKKTPEANASTQQSQKVKEMMQEVNESIQKRQKVKKNDGSQCQHTGESMSLIHL